MDILKSKLPQGIFTNLLIEGIIPGLGGIVIFIPQIAFLFFFISVLEETGYMSRVVFLMDRGLRRFGLSGKSVIPLISGTACAIPAVMATRNIENWKEYLPYNDNILTEYKTEPNINNIPSNKKDDLIKISKILEEILIIFGKIDNFFRNFGKFCTKIDRNLWKNSNFLMRQRISSSVLFAYAPVYTILF